MVDDDDDEGEADSDAGDEDDEDENDDDDDEDEDGDDDEDVDDVDREEEANASEDSSADSENALSLGTKVNELLGVDEVSLKELVALEELLAEKNCSDELGIASEAVANVLDVGLSLELAGSLDSTTRVEESS